MTFSFCSTGHNEVFLNGEKKPLETKGKCTCAHVKIAAFSPCPIIHSENSSMIWFMEYGISILPPNSAEFKVNGTILNFNVGKT